MEKKVQIGMLCEIYGKLLTKKQYSILNDYANADLSLTEIAENNNITRQAVNDIVNFVYKNLTCYFNGMPLPSRQGHTISYALDSCFIKDIFSLSNLLKRKFIKLIISLRCSKVKEKLKP